MQARAGQQTYRFSDQVTGLYSKAADSLSRTKGWEEKIQKKTRETVVYLIARSSLPNSHRQLSRIFHLDIESITTFYSGTFVSVYSTSTALF